MKKQNKNGFSLVELSIVLVVVAIIIAGVVGGQDLIRASKTNSLIKDITQYKSVFARFQVKYAQLPGDMDNAYKMWGPKCAASESACDGGGDAIVNETETYKAWKHLELSEMISGSFDKPTTHNVECIAGKNVPGASFEDVSFIFNFNHSSARTLASPAPLQAMQIGARSFEVSNPVIDNCGDIGFLTVEELFAIDKKADDGFAYDGDILNSDTYCTTSTTSGSDNGDYDFTRASLCRIFVKLRVD